MSHIVSGLLALAPVLLFLALLRASDTYRLVPVRAAMTSLIAGIVLAAFSATANAIVLRFADISWEELTRYVAPLIEELFKASWVIVLIRRHRCGFQVDTAIHGFAVGAGFALLENTYYLLNVGDAGPMLWIARGFGTAVMHGCATAIFGILARELTDRRPDLGGWVTLLPFAGAVALHSAFNHFFLPALANALVLTIGFPLLTMAVLARSERSTRRWLQAGFDDNVEVLNLLMSGQLPSSPVGRYLDNMRRSFAPDVVADMVAYIQVGLELSMQSKATLLAREAGVEIPPDEEVREKLAEFEWLEDRLGAAGRLALSPIVMRSSQDLWQIMGLRASASARS